MTMDIQVINRLELLKVCVYFSILNVVLASRRVKDQQAETTFDPRCCGPDQWEAVSFQTEGYLDSTLDYETFTEVDNTVHYDYRNKRLALEQNVWNSTSNGTHNQKVIIDFHQRLKWTLTERQCQQEIYTLPMASPCIPGDATFVKSRTVSGVKADVLKWNDTVGGSVWTYTVATDHCIKLIEFRLNHHPIFTFSMTHYDNISSGIADTDVFLLPPSCLLTLDVRLK